MSKSKDKPANPAPEPRTPPPPAAPAPGPSAAGEPSAGPSAEEQVARLQDQMMQLQADFDNFRKRTVREKNDLFDQAHQALMFDLLPVLDHMQLGLKAAAEHKEHTAAGAIRDGMALIYDQILGVLTQFGLSVLDVAGRPFDPQQCEAMAALPSESVPEGAVLDVVRAGYRLRGKLLRPAQVIVSSGPLPKPA